MAIGLSVLTHFNSFNDSILNRYVSQNNNVQLFHFWTLSYIRTHFTLRGWDTSEGEGKVIVRPGLKVAALWELGNGSRLRRVGGLGEGHVKVSPLIFRLVTVTQTEELLWAWRAPTLGESLHVDFDWLQLKHRNLKFQDLNIRLREAFKRKNWKYIGLLPILCGGGNPPTNIFPVFS